MLTKNKKSYNHLLIQLKENEQITAKKLAEIANVNLATLNAWLASPNTKKWRRLDKDRFYFIKSRLYFNSRNSFDKKHNIHTFLYFIEQALNSAQERALTAKPIGKGELEYINQAIEMNQLIMSAIYELIPPDEEEINFIESLKVEPYSESLDLEEEQYLEFLSSINKREVLDLYYKENQTPFLISNTLNVPTRLIERFIKEDREKNQCLLTIKE